MVNRSFARYLVGALVFLLFTDCTFCSLCDSKNDGWTQVWADEFDGLLVDNKSWSLDLGGGDSRVRGKLC